MNDILLLKLGEIVLKGLNRRSFEAKLVGNVRRRLVGLGNFQVSCLQSTVYVEPLDGSADMDAAFNAVQDVFGIVKISRASACEKDKDAIARLARKNAAWTKVLHRCSRPTVWPSNRAT